MPDFKVEIVIDPCKIRYSGCKIDPCNLIYITIEMFHKVKCTERHSAEFPINLCDSFKFTKCFFGCNNYFDVINALYDCPVTIELIEVDSCCYECNRSYFDGNVRDLTSLCDTGPKIINNRCINLCNKPSMHDFEEPVVFLNIQSQICRLSLFEDECSDFPCPTPRCTPKVCFEMPLSRCCSPRRLTSPRPSCTPRRASCCPSPRRPRSLSPSCLSPRIRSPVECCSPKLTPSCRVSRPDQYLTCEIERIWKNLKEMNDQVQCLMSIHRSSHAGSSTNKISRSLTSGKDKFMATLENRPIPGQRWTV